MAWVPDERRSFRSLLLVLNLLLLTATCWAVVDEVWVRRPWKAYQERWQELRPELREPIAVRQIVLPDLDAVDRCGSCHLGIDDQAMQDMEGAPPVLRAHPERDLLLGPHPTERFGCTICHGGQGLALTEEAAHAPVGGPWPEPLRDGEQSQSSCLRCHDDPRDLPGAPLLAAGWRLYGELGCAGCHAGPGEDRPRRGPSLRHVGQKLHPAALLAWIREPRLRRPGFRMPNFWPGSETDPRLAAQKQRETLALAAFLLSVAEPLPEVEAPQRGDVVAGAALFDRVGCRACHVLGEGEDDLLLDEQGRRAAPVAEDSWGGFGGEEEEATEQLAPITFGPALGAAGARLQAPWLRSWLGGPRTLDPGARMPDLRLRPAQVASLAAFLSSLGDAPPAPTELTSALDESLVKQGEQLIAGYGCFGCHEIPGFDQEGRLGPDLSDYGRKDPHEISFGDLPVPPEQRTWLRYTTEKLRHPRAFVTADVQQAMPDFALSEDEVAALRLLLRGFDDRPAPEGMSAEPDSPKRRATRLVEERNCRGCHSLKIGEEGAIARYYQGKGSLPPPLHDEGARTQPQWLYDFLLRPRTLRPWLDLRMPDFGFSEEESEDLVAWFGDRSGDARSLRPMGRAPIDPERAALGAGLFAELKCRSCHQLTGGDGRSSAELAPDLGLARQRLDPRWVRRFLEDPGAQLPGTRMPQYFPDGQTPFPDLLGGVAGAQLDLLVDHLMNLGLQPLPLARSKIPEEAQP